VPAGLTGRQASVHTTIMAVGGYWAPVNAVARLLEELAEVGELLPADPASGSPPELAGELADLWIISTVLATQFNVTVPDPGQAGPSDRAADFTGVVRAAGQIARVVNYYDGPKNPRSPGELPTLAAAVAAFQQVLAAFAARHGVGLDAAVDAKAAEAAAVDRGRFPVTPDPGTAPSVAAFAASQAGRSPSAGTAGLWGAPPWAAARSAAHNLDLTVPFLTRFAKAARPEGLCGFVIELPGRPAGDDQAALSRCVEELLTALAVRDPRPGTAPAGEGRLTFHGLPLSVTVFSPLYAEPDPRHSRQGTFVLLQPAARP
jgi:hypothetical protein